MRIASVQGQGKDGTFAHVSDDLGTCIVDPARSLQQAIDSGNFAVPGERTPFDATACLAPLPRAFQFLDGSAYVNHVELVRQARGATLPDSFWTDPLMYQGLSIFAPPTAPILGQTAWGMDFEAEIAVITDDVPMGVSEDAASAHILFVMLLNDVSLRNLIPTELAKGFGFVHSKPISSCSAVAISPDALPGWDGRKLHGRVCVELNGTPFGRADAGIDMTFDFARLIAHAAKTRDLAAGTVIGSGTVSNTGENGPGRPVADGGAGYSCIAEQRMVETILHGAPRTPFLAAGDHVEIWMQDETGQDIFGRISQTVETI
jgi:fumarylacetoacetate (FAA) hydrolase